MKSINLLHPVTHATLAGGFADDAAGARVAGDKRAASLAARRATRHVTQGCMAAIALALAVPGVAVNPNH